MSRATGREARRGPRPCLTSSPQGPRRCSGCYTLKGRARPGPALLNAAGGALPAYVADEVGSACRSMYVSLPDAAGGWVQAATASPHFFHPRQRARSVRDRGQPFGVLRVRDGARLPAGHGAWGRPDILTRGVAVSESEEPTDEG